MIKPRPTNDELFVISMIRDGGKGRIFIDNRELPNLVNAKPIQDHFSKNKCGLRILIRAKAIFAVMREDMCMIKSPT